MSHVDASFYIWTYKKIYEKVNKTLSKNSTLVKKHFERGEQLLEKQYLDINSIHVKQSDNVFCIKGVCAASLKKVDRWVTVALNIEPCNIYFAYCQCVAGKPGTCSHVLALLKLMTKWVLENLKKIPTPAACTSQQCLWSVPQSRDRVVKSPISLESRKRKNDDVTDSNYLPTISVKKEWIKNAWIYWELIFRKKEFVKQLFINQTDVEHIQQQTVQQANDPAWFEFQKYRLTASVINQLKLKNPKSDKAFHTLAKNLVSSKQT